MTSAQYLLGRTVKELPILIMWNDSSTVERPDNHDLRILNEKPGAIADSSIPSYHMSMHLESQTRGHQLRLTLEELILISNLVHPLKVQTFLVGTR